MGRRLDELGRLRIVSQRLRFRRDEVSAEFFTTIATPLLHGRFFTAGDGPEYLKQLQGLGAILAFPVTGGEAPKYKVVRDLRPGGKLLDEEISKIQRIYWIDDKPDAVRDVLNRSAPRRMGSRARRT